MCKRNAIWLCVWLLFLTALSVAQTPQNAAPQPQAAPTDSTPGESATKKPTVQPSPKPFAVQMKTAVVFLTMYCQKGNDIGKFQGTGFFIFVPDKRINDTGGFSYLVTNRHVAECIEDDGTKLQVLKTTLRLNLRTEIAGAQSEEGEITFSGRIHWYFPADDAVDLAILPIAPDETKYDYARVPVSMFATPEVIESTRIRRRQQQT